MKKLILLLFIPLVFACSSDSSDDNYDNTSNCDVVYLDDNGVTVKACPDANIGDVGTINGVQYTIVDREMLNQMLLNQEDVTKVCTTFITDLSSMASLLPMDGEEVDLLGFNVSFNQDIGSWDVSNVTDMTTVFYKLKSFNQNISYWDVSNVTNMQWMFAGALDFNKPLNDWDVSNVTNMSYMFQDPFLAPQYSLQTSFNQPLDNWDVSNVTEMTQMFMSKSFNQNINNWDVSNVTEMTQMFSWSNFNQPLDNWDVSNVTNMGGMFANSTFNQDISNWNVSNVIDMQIMFGNSQGFNQDLSSWGVGNVELCSFFCDNTPSWTLPKPNFTNCPDNLGCD